MAEKTNFYVGIKYPDALRKELLTSSRDIIRVLKRYDNIRSIRAEKIENILKLNKVMSEINALNSKLRSRLPATALRTMPERKIIVKKTKKKKTVKKSSREIDKLEAELSEIESKLGKLS